MALIHHIELAGSPEKSVERATLSSVGAQNMIAKGSSGGVSGLAGVQGFLCHWKVLGAEVTTSSSRSMSMLEWCFSLGSL